MIVDERFVTYINSLSGANTKLLEEIETEALGTDVPVIRKETQECLKLFLAMKKTGTDSRSWHGGRIFSDIDENI